MKKTRGSAIVMAILLITAIGAVAFSFGRILYLEVANASLYESGVSAYYAAESGLEEGFLRYRYNMNAEQPTSSWTPGQDLGYRYNLTSDLRVGNTTTGVSRASAAGIAPENQYFDLRMGAKVGTFSKDSVASPDNTNPVNDIKQIDYGNDSLYRIKRDESKKIDLGKIFSAGDSDINLYIKPYKNTKDTTKPTAPPLNSQNCVLIEAKIIGQKIVNGPIEERKALLKNSSGTCDYTGIIADVSTTEDYIEWDVDLAPTPQKIYKISSLKSLIAPTMPYVSATLYLKPIGADINFLLEEIGLNVSANPLPGVNNLITATGYYGGVTRTLEASIDRQSGSLYDLFDYVIYKSN